MPDAARSHRSPEPPSRRRWLPVLALLGPLLALVIGVWLRAGMARPVPREFDALLLLLALTAAPCRHAARRR